MKVTVSCQVWGVFQQEHFDLQMLVIAPWSLTYELESSGDFGCGSVLAFGL